MRSMSWRGDGGDVMRESLHVAPVGPAATARHYLRDMVYGATDGIVTVVAGSLDADEILSVARTLQ